MSPTLLFLPWQEKAPIEAIEYKRRKGHLVFPLEFCPHGTELNICADGWRDVVHDVDVDVIQDHHIPPGAQSVFIHDVAENCASLSAGHFDICPVLQRNSLHDELSHDKLWGHLCKASSRAGLYTKDSMRRIRLQFCLHAKREIFLEELRSKCPRCKVY